MEDLVESVQRQLRAAFADRSVILAGDVAAGATGLIKLMKRFGASRFLVLAGARGTGPQPESVGAEVVMYPLDPQPNTVAFFRAEERVFTNLPADVVDAIDRFDPDHNALVIGAFHSTLRRLADRPLFGARRPEWVALEDKTCNDELFDGADVPQPPSRVVPVEAALGAAAEIDAGAGTVWSGDARDGFNGGAVFVRWVCDEDDEREALEFFDGNCDCVRISPFVEGIPCSIHGFVTGDGVAAFSPVELVTLRSDGRPHLVYAGCASYFEPGAADIAAMRDAVRRAGAWLRANAGFRGAFTLDGVLSDTGWVATECNPRYGAALGYATLARPDLALLLLNYAVCEGVADVPYAPLEDAVRTAGRDHRWGGSWTVTKTAVHEDATHPIVFDADGTCHAAVDGEASDGTILLGPGPMGGFVRLTLDPERTPIGPSIAPRAASAFAWADRELGTQFGPLTPALNVR
jgi:hypothetical protein